MHEESSVTPRFNLTTALAWIGGFALVVWGFQLVSSLEFWRIVLWPVAMVATMANLKPGDDMSAVLMVFLVGSMALSVVAAVTISVVADLRKKAH